ncbi:MAG: 2-5 ligase superfamily, partial [Thermoleophilia bacterium]|nr:2-5 ligase superfamily [Thermoleophilia bacterium]
APRFHPHLTLARAAVASPQAARAAASGVAPGAVTFAEADTFGEGRIVFLEPTDIAPAQAARAAIVAGVDPDDLDPLVHTRPWRPHVTLAYAVPEATRAAALEHVRAALPIVGSFSAVQVWDLDVRPTTCQYATPVG